MNDNNEKFIIHYLLYIQIIYLLYIQIIYLLYIQIIQIGLGNSSGFCVVVGGPDGRW